MTSRHTPALLKQQLLRHCLDMQQKWVEHARKAMEEAQQAANQEERSSAGDKYDTSRAMNQNVRDMNAKQLQEALKELAVLQHINPAVVSTEAQLGSIVKTSEGNYFIAISGGPFTVKKESYFAVSAMAPLGREILNKKKGDTLVFRGKSIHIEEVY